MIIELDNLFQKLVKSIELNAIQDKEKYVEYINNVREIQF